MQSKQDSKDRKEREGTQKNSPCNQVLYGSLFAKVTSSVILHLPLFIHKRKQKFLLNFIKEVKQKKL